MSKLLEAITGFESQRSYPLPGGGKGTLHLVLVISPGATQGRGYYKYFRESLQS